MVSFCGSAHWILATVKVITWKTDIVVSLAVGSEVLLQFGSNFGAIEQALNC